MEQPSGPRQEILRHIVEHAGTLADALRTQFATCRTASEAHCDQCFDITVTADAPRLPGGIDSPIGFTANSRGTTNGVDVLVWHEHGMVTGVEISFLDDLHPQLADISIAQRWQNA